MTTPTINNIADLARILKEQPEWADAIRGILLGEELLNLPARFDEFVQATLENNRLVREELAQQRELLTQNSALLAQHGEQLAQQREQLARTNELLAQHSAQLAEQKEQLARTNELLAQHSAQLAEHTELMTQFRADLNSLNARMNRVEGRLGNLEGSDYERRVRTKALFRARNQLGLGRDAYFALTQDGLVAPQLNSAISQAFDRGDLSNEQLDDLLAADLIISDPANRHALIEVSITAQESDIARARRRADLLAATTSGSAKAGLITANLDEIQQDQASAAAVDTFLIPYAQPG